MSSFAGANAVRNTMTVGKIPVSPRVAALTEALRVGKANLYPESIPGRTKHCPFPGPNILS